MDNNIQHGWAAVCGFGVLITFIENNYQMVGLVIGFVGLIMNGYFGIKNIQLKDEELKIRKKELDL